jgi:hypothetical protein
MFVVNGLLARNVEFVGYMDSTIADFTVHVINKFYIPS